MENDYLKFVNEQIKLFKTPEVRTLAWVIAAPPIFDSLTGTDVKFLGFDFFQKEFRRIIPDLFMLDKSPGRLLNHVNNGNTRLLGKYFENLLEFWLKEFSGFDLIKSNLQIFRNGRTIGEIDFLIRDENGTVYNLEVAGKYYISDGGKEWKDFYGPNPSDNLALKMEKMLGEQIGLTANPSVKEILKNYGITVTPQPLIIFKGFLFYPFLKKNDSLRAKGASPFHLKGLWIKMKNLDLIREENLRWSILNRREWISRRFCVPHEKTLPFKKLKAKLTEHFNDNKYPALICGMKEENKFFSEKVRYFVLSNSASFDLE